MKNICLFFILLIVLFPRTVSAKTRTQNEAMQLASSFLNSGTGSMQKVSAASKVLRFSYQKSSAAQSGDSVPSFYVFNRGTNNGFVIVSADDRAKPILGYTDLGYFDSTSIPDNLKYWLSFYESEIKLLPAETASSATATNAQSTLATTSSTSYATSVAPLLGAIKWGQSAPYNNLCPTITSTGAKTVSGCVATAMAQVMMYYQWPLKGAGSNSYTSSTYKYALSLDFSQTTFDWANMTDTYSSSSTTAQNAAVATLMYNCGVAVNMNYAESSGASSQQMAIAMKTNFGYDSNIQLYTRNFYTRSEWIDLLKKELNASRPVLWAGQTTSDGGHQFICDGYDTNGLFHFNWGWTGSHNGYYQVSALNPTDVYDVDGYNGNQSIVIGVQKPTTSSVPVYLVQMSDTLSYSADSVARAAAFTVTGKSMYNRGVNVFNGSVGVALYNSGGFVQLLSSTAYSWAPNYGVSSKSFSVNIPAALPDGSYKLYYVYKSTADADWQIVRGFVGRPNYLDVTVKSSYVYFDTPASATPVLSLDTFSVSGNLYQNKTGRFNVTVTNKGAEYNSYLSVYLVSVADGAVSQVVANEVVNIASGETRSMTFANTLTLSPGKYTAYVRYTPLNNQSTSSVASFANSLTVDVLATPTGTPSLQLTSPISFPDATKVEKNAATLTANITNTTGYFDSKLIAFVFPKTGGSSLTSFGYQDAVFDANESKEVKFFGPIDLPLNQYMVNIYYLNASNKWSQLTPTASSSLLFSLTENVSAPAISLDDFSVAGNLFQNKTGRFNMKISNTGAEYNSAISVSLVSVTDASVSQVIASGNVKIASGESSVLLYTGNVTLNPGKYYAYVRYNTMNNRTTTTTNLGGALTVEVQPKLIKNTTTVGGKTVVSYGYANAGYYPGLSRPVVVTQSVNLPTLTNSNIFYKNASNAWVLLHASASGAAKVIQQDNDFEIDNQEAETRVSCYPNPTADMLHITASAEIKKIRITDLPGKQLIIYRPATGLAECAVSVTILSAGTYVLQVETATGSGVQKFIKK